MSETRRSVAEPGDLVVVVHAALRTGRYVLADANSRTVLLGPFDSHPDPDVVAQRLADQLNRRVWQETVDETGTQNGVARLFSPCATS